MFPLRLSLFALIFLAVLGMSQEAEADDWEPTLGLFDLSAATENPEFH